ncbi:MAG: hypothetical protein IKJ88_08885 [Clostridia bacterium]|nr:hypothetical protein [Clostridia bacterium]
MVNLVWRKDDSIGLEFESESEYFETLGFLAKDSRPIDIFTHENQRSGARAYQGKLRLKTSENIPASLAWAFEQSNDDRVSVSDYVDNLVHCHAFTKFVDPTGLQYTYHIYPESLEAVRNTVPLRFLMDFDRGYNL